MKSENQDLNNLLESFKGKKILILTKFNIRYQTSNFSIGESTIKFKDKFGDEVLLALDQIAQVVEVKNGGY